MFLKFHSWISNWYFYITCFQQALNWWLMNLKNLKDTYHLSRFCLRACEALNSNRDLMGIATETSNTSRQSWISVEKWTPSKWLRFFSRCCDVQQTCKLIQQRGWQWYHENLYLHYVNIFVVVFLVLHDIITLTNYPFYVRWLHVLQWLFRLLIDQNIIYVQLLQAKLICSHCFLKKSTWLTSSASWSFLSSHTVDVLFLTKHPVVATKLGLETAIGIFDDFCNPGVSEAISNIINPLLMHSSFMAPRHQAEWLVARSAAVSSATIRGGVGAVVLRVG